MSRHVYLPALTARQAPRYTSYPTALEFTGAVGAPDQAEALAAARGDALASLYVHIPYCREICWYCGCNTGAIGRRERVETYLAALVREIETVAQVYPGRVSRIHFGGGSPNALAPAQFTRLADALRERFRVEPDAEWAAELDPRLLSRDWAAALSDAGVERASLGVQTFNMTIQMQIRRIQPFRQVAAGIADLHRHGVDRINLDFMYGLPGQQLDDIAQTIAKARSLAPDRIAMFGYAHLPAVLPRQRMIDAQALPSAEARFWQSALAHDLLVEDGFEAIGFDHFARPDDSLAIASRAGRLRRNFQGFTDDNADLVIGLGASSISQFPGLLVQNEKHVGSWRIRVLNGRLAGVRGSRRSAEDRLRAELIERTLCQGRADVEAVADRHGVSPWPIRPALDCLAELEAVGVVRRDGWKVEVTTLGRPYVRLAAAAFDAFRPAVAGLTSQAV